jgi:hypothetical protein
MSRPVGRPFVRLERFDSAACGEHPQPDLWFSGNPASRAVARAICASCPVRDSCLTGALRRGERYGTWGGQDLDPVTEYPGKRWAVSTAEEEPVRDDDAEQLALPIAVAGEPSLPIRTVAQLFGVAADQIQAAVDCGELPGIPDGDSWRIPLWAIPEHIRGVA